MNFIGHRTPKSQELLRNRPHSSKKYKYKRFMEYIVPKIQNIEAKSPAMEFFYVFIDEGRKDYYDTWGYIDWILYQLNTNATKAGISPESLFSEVYVYTHSSDAYSELIDQLRAEGYKDLTEGMRNMNVYIRRGEEKHKLAILNTLQDPRRHEELMRPRETAKRAVAQLRSPNTAARIARNTAKAKGNSNNAAKTIANTVRRETIRNRARTAQTVRNTIRNTVRNTKRIGSDPIRYGIASFLTGKTPRSNRTSKTANVQPMYLEKLFGNE